jgi:DNA polymerase III epsilon subunit-like protein
MIIAAFDLETTGVDKQKDRIIEIGLALYSTGQHRVLESTGFLVDPDGVAVSDEITGITGIYSNAVEAFGYDKTSPIDSFCEYYNKAEAVIGHNILRFDMPIIYAAMARHGYDSLSEKLVIDTMTDIPGVKGEQLITMCAKAGFLYKAHGAVADATAVLSLAEYHSTNFPERSWVKIVERAKSPLVVLFSKQDNTTANNKVARKAGFRWNGDFKVWWQAIKEMDVKEFAERYPHKMEYAPKEITLEQLRDDS